MRRGPHHADAERGRYRHSAANGSSAPGRTGLEPTNRGRLAAYAKRIAGMAAESIAGGQAVQRLVGAERELRNAPLANSIAWLFSKTNSQLLAEIADCARRIAPAGAVNGLAQALLKLTASGVPDIYQGTEYWDFSLVDPDNRTPVDFAVAKAFAPDNIGGCVGGRACGGLGGRPHQASDDRPRSRSAKENASPFRRTVATCRWKRPVHFLEHVFAFARILGNSAAVVAICRCYPEFFESDDGSLTIPPARWKDTRILLPRELQGIRLGSVLTGEEIATGDQPFAAAQILSSLPVALLKPDQSR